MSTVKNLTLSAGRGSQSGFSLIEALIATLILEIGVLGIIGLLAVSKVSHHEAIQRTRATTLADDILERIRRNPAGMTTYDDRGLGNPLGNNSIADQPGIDCGATSCTPQQLAAHDLWAWEQLLAGKAETLEENGQTVAAADLRGLRGCIDFTADAGKANTGIINIILQWQGMTETSDAVINLANGVCGENSSRDDRRRQLVLSSYVIDENE